MTLPARGAITAALGTPADDVTLSGSGASPRLPSENNMREEI